MTGHEYLVRVLENQNMKSKQIEHLRRLREKIETVLRNRYRSSPRIYYGGSYAKHTMIREAFDLDVIIYFPCTKRATLKEIYQSVHETLVSANYPVRPKTVALQLPYEDGFHIDVVPGRAIDETFYEAYLYKNGQDTWIKTSLKKQMDSIKDSGCREIIKLMKLWRIRHRLEWSTFALEQTVIRALNGENKNRYDQCLIKVFEFIYKKIDKVRLVDPANANNIIKVSPKTRSSLKKAAERSLNARDWGEIIK